MQRAAQCAPVFPIPPHLDLAQNSIAGKFISRCDNQKATGLRQLLPSSSLVTASTNALRASACIAWPFHPRRSRRISDVEQTQDFVEALEAPPGPRSTAHTLTSRTGQDTNAFTTASTTEQYQQIRTLQTENYHHRYTIAQHGVHFRASARGRPR